MERKEVGFERRRCGFSIWQEASRELPGKTVEDNPSFLREWSNRLYADAHSRNSSGNKRFGLSRATAILHFMTGGEFPIYDSRVRRAIRRLTGSPAPDTIRWYLGLYRRMFSELKNICNTTARSLDKALFACGGKALEHSQMRGCQNSEDRK